MRPKAFATSKRVLSRHFLHDRMTDTEEPAVEIVKPAKKSEDETPIDEMSKRLEGMTLSGTDGNDEYPTDPEIARFVRLCTTKTHRNETKEEYASRVQLRIDQIKNLSDAAAENLKKSGKFPRPDNSVVGLLEGYVVDRVLTTKVAIDAIREDGPTGFADFIEAFGVAVCEAKKAGSRAKEEGPKEAIPTKFTETTTTKPTSTVSKKYQSRVNTLVDLFPNDVPKSVEKLSSDEIRAIRLALAQKSDTIDRRWARYYAGMIQKGSPKDEIALIEKIYENAGDKGTKYVASPHATNDAASTSSAAGPGVPFGLSDYVKPIGT